MARQHNFIPIRFLAALLVLEAQAATHQPGPDVPEPGEPPTAPLHGFVPSPRGDFAVSSGSVDIFADEAERGGMRVSEAEVARWRALHAKMYPGQAAPEPAERFLLAEKYLEANRLASGPGSSDSAFNAKWNDTLFASPEEAAQARKIIRFQDAFSRKEVRNEGDRLRDVQQIRMFDDRVEAPMWDLEAIQVAGDPSECLAWIGSNCMVQLGEYNAAALQYRVPASLPLDSARVEILRRYLPVKRIADSARALGVDWDTDSLARESEYRQTTAHWLNAAQRFGRPISDHEKLKSLYGSNYQKYFAPRVERILAIIGSSDSVHLDSLYRIQSAWETSNRARKNPQLPSLPEPALPWSYFKESELPREFKSALSGFRIGQCTPPFRTGLGYFLARITDAARTPEVAFREALPILLFLASREKYLGMDSVVEAQARQYYSRHKARFARPDTLELKTWLAPRPRTVSETATRTGKRNLPIHDTAAYRSVRISSLNLPDVFRMRIQDSARLHSKDSLIGPLTDKFGTWHFRILSRKVSSDTLPYRLARKGILETLTSPPPPMERAKATLEGQTRFFEAQGLADAFVRQKYAEAAEPGREPGKDPGTKLHRPPDLRSPEKRGDILGSARLNTARLFSGS